MSITTHERPGVYSSYGASSLIRGSGGRKTVGLVAVNTKATAKTVYTITSYEEAVTTFGSAGGQDMAELIRVILLNGAAAVAAVPIAASTDYEAGFAVLEGQENVSVVVCDSTTQTDQQDLRDSVAAASAARRERIAVVGGAASETVTNLISRAAALNSERVVLVAPGGTDEDGTALSGITAAAAVAGAIAAQSDPALPLSGAELTGLHGLSQQYNDNDIDLLVRGGVTPLESVAGVGGPGHHHPHHHRGVAGHHLAGAVHHFDRGRRDPLHPGEPAGQVPPGQEYRAEPGGHPLPGDSGAGEQAEPGDHHQPDLADGQHYHLSLGRPRTEAGGPHSNKGGSDP